MTCEELLSTCVYALVGSFGAVVTAFIAYLKAKDAQKEVKALQEEKKV